LFFRIQIIFVLWLDFFGIYIKGWAFLFLNIFYFLKAFY